MISSTAQEKMRISEQLKQLDAERERLSADLNQLEIAERVLARFERKSVSNHKPAHSAASAPASRGKRSTRGGQQKPSVSLKEAALKAVKAHAAGATSAEVLEYLSQKFGMSVRPNHLGMALHRHRRAGRLDNRNERWHLASPA